MATNLPVGTIVQRKNGYDRWVVKSDTHWRKLEWKDRDTGASLYPKDWKVIGRLPPSKLDAMEWDDKYRLPEAYDPEKHYLYWGATHYIGDDKCWTYAHTDYHEANKKHLEKYVVERPRSKREDWGKEYMEFLSNLPTGPVPNDARIKELEKELAGEKKWSNYWRTEYYTIKDSKKGSFMKKSIILVAAGALISHLPLIDLYVSSVEYFKGSKEVVHGEFAKVKVCSECETRLERENAVICPKCGTENIETRVAAPLYRDRGWPLADILVGTQFRNADGTTRIVLEDE